MERNANAVWRGGIKDGKGSLTTDSGVLSDTLYSFSTRFEDEKGTNPEELIAAAHAGCFSMALSLILGETGIKPEQIDTMATVTIEKGNDGFSINHIHLDVHVRAPGVDQSTFDEAAAKAKAGCPVSKVLNADISMEAQLSN